MYHVQIPVLVSCFVLLNLAQIADKMLLMVCLFLRHQFPSKLSTVETEMPQCIVDTNPTFGNFQEYFRKQLPRMVN